MDDKRPFLIPLALFGLIACGLLSLPVYIYQQYPQLDTYGDTHLTEQSWHNTFSRPLCLLNIQQNKKMRSEAHETVVWQRLAAEWNQQQGNYIGRHDEAYYQHILGAGLTLKSSVFAQNTTPLATFIVNNQLVLQLPQRLCNPFGSLNIGTTPDQQTDNI